MGWDARAVHDMLIFSCLAKALFTTIGKPPRTLHVHPRAGLGLKLRLCNSMPSHNQGAKIVKHSKYLHHPI